MLSSGAQVGPYQIVAALGAGGMGEVYRARDPKLDREVAIKVLPEALATDPACIARFDREARTLAALNHPNIAHVYGLEQAGSRTPEEAQPNVAASAAAKNERFIDPPPRGRR